MSNAAETHDLYFHPLLTIAASTLTLDSWENQTLSRAAQPDQGVDLQLHV